MEQLNRVCNYVTFNEEDDGASTKARSISTPYTYTHAHSVPTNVLNFKQFSFYRSTRNILALSITVNEIDAFD